MRAQSVIRPTKARPGAAEQRVVMRSIALLLITCLWYGCHAAEDLRGELRPLAVPENDSIEICLILPYQPNPEEFRGQAERFGVAPDRLMKREEAS